MALISAEDLALLEQLEDLLEDDTVFCSFESLDEATDLGGVFGMPSAQLLDPACAVRGLSGVQRQDLLLQGGGERKSLPHQPVFRVYGLVLVHGESPPRKDRANQHTDLRDA